MGEHEGQGEPGGGVDFFGSFRDWAANNKGGVDEFAQTLGEEREMVVREWLKENTHVTHGEGGKPSEAGELWHALSNWTLNFEISRGLVRRRNTDLADGE